MPGCADDRVGLAGDSAPFQSGTPDGRVVGAGTLALLEVLCSEIESPGSCLQVGEREPHAIVVGGGPPGLVDLGLIPSTGYPS